MFRLCKKFYLSLFKKSFSFIMRLHDVCVLHMYAFCLLYETQCYIDTCNSIGIYIICLWLSNTWLYVGLIVQIKYTLYIACRCLYILLIHDCILRLIWHSAAPPFGLTGSPIIYYTNLYMWMACPILVYCRGIGRGALIASIMSPGTGRLHILR